MVIRNALASDLDQLAAIWHDGWHEAHAHLLPAELTRLRTFESFRDRLGAVLAEVRVAAPAGEPVGFCLIKGDELYQLFVSPRGRGTGAAAALVSDAEVRLSSRGVTRAWLACAIGNDRAARFYQKCGWVLKGTMINEAETSQGPFALEVWRYEKPLLTAAENYEQTVVPSLTAEWAPRVAAAARVRAGERVLDVACGTGILAAHLAERVGESGSVTGIDLDPGMLDVARRRAARVEWRQGSADQLPFSDRQFDVVVSQFGMMFFPDRPRAVREMWRVLAPHGRMVVAVWASLRETPAYAAEVALVERIAGEAAADVLRSPFVLGERPEFQSVFEQAGVPLASLETRPGTGRFATIRAMLESDLLAWLPFVGMQLPPDVIERILLEGEQALAEYRSPDGTVVFASPAHLAIARKT